MLRTIPVVIICYDRERELEALLQCITRQITDDLRVSFKFFAALDYSTSKKQSDIKALLRKYLIDVEILQSSENIGIARNFSKIEKYLFEDLKYDYVAFLEDDLVLAPHYFALFERFMDFMENNPCVGMISGRGNARYPSYEEQLANMDKFVLCDEHNWGFLLRRDAYVKRKILLHDYYDLMEQINYRDRNKTPNKEIINEIKNNLGYLHGGSESSQDSMKNAAMARAGFMRLATFTVNAQYVGVNGEHSNIQKFSDKGHLNQVIFDRLPEKLSFDHLD